MKALILFLLLFFTPTIQAILQTAAIEIHHSHDQILTMLASQASFGPNLFVEPPSNPLLTPIVPPTDDSLLCNTYIGPTDTPNVLGDDASPQPTVMLVPRGTCSFERKTLAAQRLGASAVLIYGTLSSRYSLNETNGDVLYPQRFHDYDCNKTMAYIPLSALSFSVTPYDAMGNDPVLSGPGSNNLCRALGKSRNGKSVDGSCPSQACLLTGTVYQPPPSTGDEPSMEACCAWDLPIWLYSDYIVHENTTYYEPVRIPALYLTMQQSRFFLDGSIDPQTVSLRMYQRYQPKYNVSALLLWAMGVGVATLAAYMSASGFRRGRWELEEGWKVMEGQNGSNGGGSETMEEVEIAASTSDGTNGSRTGGGSRVRNRSMSPPYDRAMDVRGDGYQPVGTTSNTDHHSHSDGSQPRDANEETLELTMFHAIGFVFFSGAGLCTLYYFKIYGFVRILYAFSCCNAMVVVIFQPFYEKVLRRLRIRDGVAFRTNMCEIGTVTYAGLLAILTSYSVGGVWTYISFTVRHADVITFYWIVQDIMGACVCISFLSMIRLNGLKVATMLLVAAFFYDIFFVFVTPYLTRGGKSIMIDVATSGGPPKASPEWCEKYPDTKECQGGDLLPMLLTMPRLFDYAGGSSLLGLGDIVLPGLLLSFAARYDEAKRYMSAHRDGNDHYHDNNQLCTESKGRYFPPVCVAYAVGLMMANSAVYLMNMGQPALLYLVPCTLGTISFLGWKRKEFDEMWKTPKVLTTCEELLYGREEECGVVVSDEGENQPVIQESGLT